MNAWSLQKQIEDMDAAGVTRSLLSVTTPGVPATGERRAHLAREYQRIRREARRRQRPPLRLLHLRADGRHRCRTEGDRVRVRRAQGARAWACSPATAAHWLGDARFDPLFAELEPPQGHRLRAPDQRRLLRPPDSRSRRHADRVRHRHHARHRQLRVSRRGAPLPERADDLEPLRRHDALSHRALRWRRPQRAAAKAQAPDGFRALAARFCYDIAQASNPVSTTGAARASCRWSTSCSARTTRSARSLEHVQGLEAAKVFNRQRARRHLSRQCRALPAGTAALSRSFESTGIVKYSRTRNKGGEHHGQSGSVGDVRAGCRRRAAGRHRARRAKSC